MRTVEIPGGTAVLREREDVRVRNRRLVENATVAAMPALEKVNPEGEQQNLSTEEADSLFALQDATIVALLVSWTLQEQIPTLSTVGDMDPEIYDALAQATRETGAEVVSAESFDPTPDDGSPTQPSGDSESGLREDGSPSTPRSRRAGKSTATEGSSEDSPTTST